MPRRNSPERAGRSAGAFLHRERSRTPLAKVAFRADIQDLRGKIGTHVFTRARNRATVSIHS